MYLPVLKWKQGEQWACKGLSDEIADSTFPLLEIPPRPVDPKTKAPKKSVEAYLDSVAKSITSSWSADRRFAVDLTLLEESLDGADTIKVIETLFKQLGKAGYRAVPVARSDHRPLQLQAVKQAAALSRQGLVIRCIWEDVNQGTLAEILEYLGGELAIKAEEVDLAIDLRTVSFDNFSGLEVSVPAALATIKNPTQWKSITLIGGAFPRNLTGFKPGRHIIQRLDWKLFCSLSGIERKLGRQLQYGDYGVVNRTQYPRH